MSALLDPRLRQAIKLTIMQVLYGPYNERRHYMLADLVERNQRLQGNTYLFFTYKAERYSNGMIRGLTPRNPLHPELHQEMQAWLDEETIRKEREDPMVNSYLSTVLASSDSFHDWMRLLPDAVKPAIQKLKEYGDLPPRLSEEQVQQILTTNAACLDLMRQRMTMNLIF